MATVLTPPDAPALGTHERGAAGEDLQATLVELIDLSLIGKQFHWNLVGPQFRPLHLQLDELVDSWRELGDTVAERSVALGYPADGRAETVSADSPLDKVEAGPIDDVTMVRELSRLIAEVAERIRDRMDRLGEIDAASQDVLVEVIRELEKQLWMVRSQLPEAERA